MNCFRAQKSLHPGGLSKLKRKGRGSDIQFTTKPSITSHVILQVIYIYCT